MVCFFLTQELLFLKNILIHDIFFLDVITSWIWSKNGWLTLLGAMDYAG